MTVAGDGGAAGPEVSVAWHSTAVREVAGYAAGKLADCGSGLPGFGDWAEQLIAEVTGKQGRGILPVTVLDEDAPGFSPGPDIHLIALGAAARPVDTSLQPGVPAFTDGAVDVYADPALLPGSGGLAEVFDALLIGLPDRGYLAVMAYLDRDVDRAVTGLRDALAARTTHPVTFGWGPRFLHSTGQYHKGGPRNGLFLQITGAVEHDVEVPGRDFTLGKLQLAQALGDLGALRQRGRPAIRLHLRDRAAGLAKLLDSARASMNGATR
jgi:glucose-6-phosphate isomerase